MLKMKFKTQLWLTVFMFWVAFALELGVIYQYFFEPKSKQPAHPHESVTEQNQQAEIALLTALCKATKNCVVPAQSQE